MKKTFRILSVMALACLVVFGSCKKNENENNNSTNENGTLSAGIVQPNNGAKTSITINGSEGIIKWTEGDQIVVGDASQSGTFTLLEGAGESTAVFRCPEFPVDELEYYTAAYPASAATVSGTAVTFNIPAEQTLTRIEDGFGNGANPMVAYATAPLDQLEFKSVFGGVGIKLQAPVLAPASITKLVLTDNNNNLCGQFSVADVTVDEPSATYVSGGGHSITLNLPAGGLRVDNEGCNVYIMLPVGALSNGFTLDAYCGDNMITTKSTTSTEALITVNQINNAVTYNVELPAGQASTPEAVQALASDPNVTTITVLEGAYDFENASLPANKQIAIAEGAEVEISNLTASTTTANAAMQIGEGANVVLDGVTLTSNAAVANNRAINIYEDNTTVVIRNSTITTTNTSGAYSRGLNLGGQNTNVTVENSTITASQYAINVVSDADMTITLTNTEVNGWAAVNLWSPTVLHATGCTFNGVNNAGYHSSNTFATLVINYNSGANHDCEVVLDNCTVTAQSTTGSKQYLALIPGLGNNSIMLTNSTITGTTTNTGDYLISLRDVSGSEFTIDWDDYTDEHITWDGSDPRDSGKSSIQGKPSTTPSQEVVVTSNESSKK